MAEAKGTGIGTMRRLMKEAAMMPPTFESDHSRNTFTTRILLHNFLSENDLLWLTSLGTDDLNDAQKVALIFIREVGAIDNITYRQLSGVSAKDASKELKSLVSFDFIEAKGKGRQTYYVPTDKLKSLYTNGATSECNGATSECNGATSECNGATSECNGATSECNGATSDEKVVTLGGKVVTLDTFGENIIQKIHSLGKRCKKSELEELIIEMCKVRPLSIDEIAILTKRTENHIRNKVLPGLLREKRIQFTIPEMKNHPSQKYTATK